MIKIFNNDEIYNLIKKNKLAIYLAAVGFFLSTEDNFLKYELLLNSFNFEEIQNNNVAYEKLSDLVKITLLKTIPEGLIRNHSEFDFYKSRKYILPRNIIFLIKFDIKMKLKEEDFMKFYLKYLSHPNIFYFFIIQMRAQVLDLMIEINEKYPRIIEYIFNNIVRKGIILYEFAFFRDFSDGMYDIIIFNNNKLKETLSEKYALKFSSLLDFKKN